MENPGKLRRSLWIVAAGLALLALAGAIVLPRLLDAGRLRPLLEAALERSTGWNAEVGEVDYSILGGMVLTVRPLGLRDGRGESALEVARVEIRASPWALLRRRLDVQRVRLIEPRYRMVRERAGDPWPLPLGASDSPEPATTASGAGVGIAIRIERIDISRGALSFEDRSVAPPRSFALEQIEAELRPEARELRLDALLATSGGSGRLHGEGRVDRSLRFTLDALATETLHPLVGPDLLHAGGTVSGALEWKPPLEFHADLTAKRISLLAGEQPLESAELAFDVRGEGERLTLTGLTLSTGETRLTASGALSPDLDLRLEMPTSPIESVLSVARALFPFPLDFEPPGSGRASIHVFAPRGEELRYGATGELEAAGLRLADYLPRAEHLRVGFTLAPSGELVVDILDGDVAGGPLTGRARLDRVHPAGVLTFEGSLSRAPLGVLLAGFLGESAKAVQGPSAIEASLRLDLGARQVDLSALSGQVRLSSEAVTLPGWDLERAVAQGLEQKLGLRLAAGGEEPSSAVKRLLDRLGAQVDFGSSPWKLPELQLAGQDFQAGGGGAFDAAAGRVDLTLAVRFSAARTAEWVSRYPALKGLVRGESLTLPLEIEGPMTSPAVHVDLKGVAAGALGLGDEPKEGLRGLLEGLIQKELDKKKKKEQ